MKVKKNKGEEKDMLTELPNCLLVSILSRLSLKDAVRTSILSRRWRHLFLLNPNLVIDGAHIFGDDQEHQRFKLSSYEDFENERREFFRRVDQFMQQKHGRHIRSLTVGFFMDSECSSHLDEWLKIAIAPGLTRLELLLSSEQNILTKFYVDKDRLYNFPYWLFSGTNTPALRHLRLHSCVMRAPGDFKGFRNLRNLELNNVILAEDFAKELLPSCLQLEQLTLVWCSIKSTLCFDHPYLPLKHLKLLHCLGRPMIKISSTTLTTFEYDRDMMKIECLYAPQLKEMCSINTCWRSPLSLHFSRLPKLETLLLFVDHHRMQIPSPISLTNLKQLSLYAMTPGGDFDLSWVISFLKAAPLLQKLALTLFGDVPCAAQKDIRRLDGIHHGQLKEFEMHGCAGNWYEIELQLFVLSMASRLKRLVISPSRLLYAGNGQWTDFPVPKKACWDQSGQEMVRKGLQNHIPCGVQLVFL